MISLPVLCRENTTSAELHFLNGKKYLSKNFKQFKSNKQKKNTTECSVFCYYPFFNFYLKHLLFLQDLR